MLEKQEKKEGYGVFERIHQRITDLDVDRQRNEQKLQHDIGRCLETFEEYKFIFEHNEKA